jgi:transcriptional regulator with XRE-family HTH domain
MAKSALDKSFKTIDTSIEMRQLGTRIREIRKRKGYTNYETFANEHDIHRVQWGRYEQGKDLYFSTVIKIIRILDVSIAEFFSEGFE